MPLFSSNMNNPKEMAKQIGGDTGRYISTQLRKGGPVSREWNGAERETPYCSNRLKE